MYSDNALSFSESVTVTVTVTITFLAHRSPLSVARTQPSLGTYIRMQQDMGTDQKSCENANVNIGTDAYRKWSFYIFGCTQHRHARTNMHRWEDVHVIGPRRIFAYLDLLVVGRLRHEHLEHVVHALQGQGLHVCCALDINQHLLKHAFLLRASSQYPGLCYSYSYKLRSRVHPCRNCIDDLHVGLFATTALVATTLVAIMFVGIACLRNTMPTLRHHVKQLKISHDTC
jgi:hypothetical protein